MRVQETGETSYVGPLPGSVIIDGAGAIGTVIDNGEGTIKYKVYAFDGMEATHICPVNMAKVVSEKLANAWRREIFKMKGVVYASWKEQR